MSLWDKTLIIKVLRDVDKGGWVCIATNGDQPFGGRIHPSIEDAIADLEAAYGNDTWHGHRVTLDYLADGYEIDID